MTIRKKVLAVVVCVLLMITGITATLAYFTDQETVTNTFTVGKVGISLDEAETDELGVPVQGAERVTENTYKLIPGYSYVKDPTIHVDEESDECWVYVTVENQIKEIEAEGAATISSQMEAEGWTVFVDKDEATVYTYKDPVSGGADVKVFESFTIAGEGVTNDVLNDEQNGYRGKQIIVTAYAIQKAGFDDAETAWNTAKADFNK